MITLDISSIENSQDEVYSVERGSKVRIFSDKEYVKSCVYCNVTKGFAIRVKRDLSDNLIISEGCVVHELVFGEFTVEPIIDEFFTNQKRDNQRVRDLSKNKDRVWLDSCKPDDKN